MCDYSLEDIDSRRAEVGDRLRATTFSGTACRGFADGERMVCLLPGTEIAFNAPIRWQAGLFRLKECVSAHRVARFRQIDPDEPYTQHDALELPDGTIVFLNQLVEGQQATVLQLPHTAHVTAEVAEAL